MNKNLETECKVLLNSEDYELIYDYFNLNKALEKKQVNYYFDTVNFNLANNKINLRVRHTLYDNVYTLTVKIPQKGESNLEINQEISYEEFCDFIKYHKIPNGYIYDLIKEVNKEEVILLASLVTTRYEFEYENGLLALDYNEYNNKYDYELEFEGSNIEYCKEIITKLLNRLNIEFTFSRKSKRKRAIESRV